MLIFPEMELKDGKVVLPAADGFSKIQQLAQDPIALARAICEAGARYIQIVDSGGAEDGTQTKVIQDVVRTGLNVQIAGRIQSMADLEEAFRLGVWRAVIAGPAVGGLEFVKAAVEQYGSERIAAAVDAREGVVCMGGEAGGDNVDYLTFARRMEACGIKHLIFTDIGVLPGPSFARLKFLQNAAGCSVTASGGVSSNADLRALKRMGIPAVVVGRAWYAGAIDLRQAVEEG